MEVKQLLLDTVLFSSIALGLLSILFFNRLNAFGIYIGLYAILLAIFEPLAVVLMKFFNTVNNAGMHVYILLEFIIIMLFFNNIFKIFKTVLPIKLTVSIGCFLIILNTLFIQSINSIPVYSRTTVDFLIISLSITYFILLIKNINHKLPLRSANFFVTAILIKAAVSIVIYLFSNSILKMQSDLRELLFIFIVVINFIAIILVLISLIHLIKKKEAKVNQFSSSQELE